MKELSIEEKEKVIMYKEIIPYHYCSSPSIKEEERWRATNLS